MDERGRDIHRATMARAAHNRRMGLTRRRMLQASSAAELAALAAEFTPKTVYADVSGEVVHLTATGKRFDGVVRGLTPLFEKAYPNIKVKITTIPTNELLNKVNIYMQ